MQWSEAPSVTRDIPSLLQTSAPPAHIRPSHAPAVTSWSDRAWNTQRNKELDCAMNGLCAMALSSHFLARLHWRFITITDLHHQIRLVMCGNLPWKSNSTNLTDLSYPLSSPIYWIGRTYKNKRLSLWGNWSQLSVSKSHGFRGCIQTISIH